MSVTGPVQSHYHEGSPAKFTDVRDRIINQRQTHAATNCHRKHVSINVTAYYYSIRQKRKIL